MTDPAIRAALEAALFTIRKLASLPAFDTEAQRRGIWECANRALRAVEAAAKEPGHE